MKNPNKKKTKITLKDLARKAGVSTTTASLILNNVQNLKFKTDTIQKVLNIAEELRYEPNRIAKGLAGGGTKIIGYLVSGLISPLFSTTYFEEVLRGVGYYLGKNGFNLLIFYINKDETTENLHRRTIDLGLLDGIIIEGNLIKDDFVLKLEDNNFPYVLLARKIFNKEINCVLFDYFKASYNATSHLINLGHKCIGFISGPDDSTMTNILDRKLGYISSFNDKKISINPNIIKYNSKLTKEAGYSSMQEILRNDVKPTAILAINDMLAIGAMEAIEDNNLKIPDDIAVIGFDDMPEALMVKPKLTSIRFPWFRMGELGSKMLLQLLKDKDSRKKRKCKVLPTKLILRESC